MVKNDDSQAKRDGIAFWTKHTRPVLSSLLSSVGEYTDEEQDSHLEFLEKYIIPTMGRAPEPSRARSFLTPNGSPFETSLNTTDSGKSYVRFCYEPVFPGSDGVTEDPIPAIAEAVGADLRWFNQFAAHFYPSEEDEVILKEKLPQDGMRIPKVFLAFDLVGGKRSMKAYFYPVMKYMTTKLNCDRASLDLIRRLDPCGPLFEAPLKLIEKYQTLLYGDPPLSGVVGIDCVTPEEGARVKVYIDPQSNSWATMENHFTLGGKLTDESTLAGLRILKDMWNLLMNEPESRTIDPDLKKETLSTQPSPSGACFSWELTPGKSAPDVKIYFPLRQYYKTDRAIIEALEKVFSKRGWAWGVDGAYKKIISNAL